MQVANNRRHGRRTFSFRSDPNIGGMVTGLMKHNSVNWINKYGNSRCPEYRGGGFFHMTEVKMVKEVKEVKVKTHFFCFFNIHFYLFFSEVKKAFTSFTSFTSDGFARENRGFFASALVKVLPPKVHNLHHKGSPDRKPDGKVL